MNDTWLSQEIETSYPSDALDELEPTPGKERLWTTDTGTLSFACRKVLLQLIRGPMVSGKTNPDSWRELVNNERIIRSRLADLFLELIVDPDNQIAFVRNPSGDMSSTNPLPKAVKSLPLKLLDSVMLLLLRNELLTNSNERVMIGREELFGQMTQFRPLAKLDEAAFRKRLEASWSKLEKGGVLLRTDNQDRCEISPILSLIFGVDEVRAIEAEYERMIAEGAYAEDLFENIGSEVIDR